MVKQDARTPIHKVECDIHGEFDLLNYTCAGYFVEPGNGSKDTNMTLVSCRISLCLQMLMAMLSTGAVTAECCPMVPRRT